MSNKNPDKIKEWRLTHSCNCKEKEDITEESTWTARGFKVKDGEVSDLSLWFATPEFIDSWYNGETVSPWDAFEERPVFCRCQIESMSPDEYAAYMTSFQNQHSEPVSEPHSEPYETAARASKPLSLLTSLSQIWNKKRSS